MTIKEFYDTGKPVFSFEFFPPKTDKGARALMHTVADLKDAVDPDFVSITYGAGGSTRARTLEAVAHMQRDLGMTTMAHMTCVGATPEDILQNMRSLTESGVENVLALRGDPPRADAEPEERHQAFAHADDLITFLRENFQVCVGAACYPEVHPESPTPQDDLHWTKHKVECGAEFLVTQLFFDNSAYWKLVQRARTAGIGVPIVPGIMPITNVDQLERFTQMCGATIPEALRERLTRYAADPAIVMANGIEQAIKQCRELLGMGAPGIHFYTLNRSHATRSILAALR